MLKQIRKQDKIKERNDVKEEKKTLKMRCRKKQSNY